MKWRGAGVATRALGPGPTEDGVLLLDRLPLVALCDGFGGVGAGDVASGLAIGAIRDRSGTVERLVAATYGDRSSGARLALSRTLERFVTDAHHAVGDVARQQARPGMATTVALVALGADHLQLAHVGAVRVYLFRRTGPASGTLRCLTEDHTIGALRLRNGHLSADEYRASPLRKRLYAALGVGGDVDVDLRTVDVADGDRLLLCTQGIHGVLDDAQIQFVLADGAPQQAADALVTAAVSRGLEDDATAVVLDVGGHRDAAMVEALDTVLRENRLFRGFTPAERAAVAPYLDERTLAPTERLFREGDPGDAFYVVARGTLRITHGGTPLTDVGPGMSFGELCLARDAPRSATVYAATESVVCGLTRERFTEVTARRPAIGAKILAAALGAIGDRLVEVTDRLSVVDRLASGVLASPEPDLLAAVVRAARGQWSPPPAPPAAPRPLDLPPDDDLLSDDATEGA